MTPVLFDRWARAVDESSKATAPRLILEMALVDLCQAEPLEPLGDLLERLEGLEARLQPATGAISQRTTGGGGGGGGGARSSVQPTSPVRASAAPAVTAPARAVEMPASPPREVTSAPPASGYVAGGAGIDSDRVGGVSSGAAPGPAEAWRRVKSELEKRRPRIGALLANAHVLEIDVTKLVLGFDDRTDLDAAERVRTDLELALSNEMKSPVRLVLKQDQGASTVPLIRAETLDEADARSADKHKREQEARQHPIIQRAQDLFGVAIREIKT